MPTYEYQCSDCGELTEAFQSFTDPALTDCPSCPDGSLRKRFGNVGVVFKGSGFYRTDSRNEARSKASNAKPRTEKASSDTPSGDKTSSDKTSASKDNAAHPAKDSAKDKHKRSAPATSNA